MNDDAAYALLHAGMTIVCAGVAGYLVAEKNVLGVVMFVCYTAGMAFCACSYARRWKAER